jgi:TusA-related sulfurtransferase
VEKKADHTLDFRGTISTISLLKVTQVFNEMKPMETIEILGCDEDTRKDLFRVLPEASYDLIYNDEVTTQTRYHRVHLRKRTTGISAQTKQ